MGGGKGVYGVIGVCFWGAGGRRGRVACVCVRGEMRRRGGGPGRDGVSEPVGRETAPETAPWRGPRRPRFIMAPETAPWGGRLLPCGVAP